MSVNIEVETGRDPVNNISYAKANIRDDSMSLYSPRMIIESVVEKIACAIVDRYQDEIIPVVLKHISPEAIATMSMAKSGAGIAEQINGLAKVEARPVNIKTENHTHKMFSLF